jgi:predicted ArsR family transcriptional regulator
MSDFERDLAGISTLADPVRRQLYRFVCSQAEPVSRDQAAQALGIARHQAKFHLDRLEAEGLLETDYVRLTGRTGPGAGRPAKRYRRGDAQLTVSLPPRDYGLAGRILADAIADADRTGTPIRAAVTAAAATQGTAMATTTDRPTPPVTALDQAVDLLTTYGYEPQRSGAIVLLSNCPFHELARRHTQLVCQMNQALIASLADSLAPDLLDVRLDPGKNRCCVTLAVRRTSTLEVDPA